MNATVKMKADMLGMTEETSDRWYLTNGTNAIGPVNLDLIARGIESGRVPLESFVRHEAWKVWRPLADFALVIEPDLGDAGRLDPLGDDTPLPRFVLSTTDVSIDDLAPEGLDELWSPTTTMRGHAVLAPTMSPRAGSSDDITAPARPSTPAEQHPADALAGAGGFEQALSLTLAAAVKKTHSDAALVHRLDGDAAVLVGSFGTAITSLRTPILDPAIVAASANQRVVSEPTPGPAGRAILARFAKLGVTCGEPIESALMFPIHSSAVHGAAQTGSGEGERLLGMLELARSKPYRASEIASAEELVEVLAAEARAEGWATRTH